MALSGVEPLVADLAVWRVEGYLAEGDIKRWYYDAFVISTDTVRYVVS